jgi:hypothetical protein
MGKLVDIEHLEHFKFLLETLLEDGQNKNKLIGYFDKNILETEKKDINELKKTIYNFMIKSPKNSKKNKDYYALYQGLKNNEIDYNEALAMFSGI